MDDPFHAIRDRIDPARIEVYVSTWCFDCRRLKSFLDRHDVGYSIVNISHDQAAAERLERETGKRGVPFVLVDGARWVAGYHRGAGPRLDQERFVRELGEALTAG